jgi:hypothetical protein
LPDPEENIFSYLLQTLVGHAIAWMEQNIRGEASHPEPPPGCFSNQEISDKVEEEKENYPLQPSVFMWYLLALLEFDKSKDNSIFERLARESKNSSFPVLLCNIENLRIKHSLKSLKIHSIVSEFVCFITYYEESRKYMIERRNVFEKEKVQTNVDNHKDLSGHVESLINLLFAALVVRMNRGKDIKAQFKKWRKDAREFKCYNKKLEDWLNYAEQGTEKNLEELISALNDINDEMRYLAALFISLRESIMPEDRFHANVLLVINPNLKDWHKAIENDIEQLLSKNWLNIAKNQKFALLIPNIYAPKIIDACNETSSGFKKAAKILLVARNAVRIRTPDKVIYQLKEIAETN